MPGEGIEEGAVIVGRILLLPEVPANMDLVEQACRFDLRYIVRIPIGRRGRPLSGRLSPIAS
jgi:hypothetical protein